jgi:hypothetical protein
VLILLSIAFANLRTGGAEKVVEIGSLTQPAPLEEVEKK